VSASQPGAPSSPAFALRLVVRERAEGERTNVAATCAKQAAEGGALSTRRLIVAAMIVGLAILIAFTIQVLLVT